MTFSGSCRPLAWKNSPQPSQVGRLDRNENNNLVFWGRRGAGAGWRMADGGAAVEEVTGRWLTGYQVKVTLRHVYVRAYIAPTFYSILFSIPQQRKEAKTRKAIRNIKVHFWNGSGAVNYPQMGAFKVENILRHPAGLSFVRLLPPGGPGGAEWGRGFPIPRPRCRGKSSQGCLFN